MANTKHVAHIGKSLGIPLSSPTLLVLQKSWSKLRGERDSLSSNLPKKENGENKSRNVLSLVDKLLKIVVSLT